MKHIIKNGWPETKEEVSSEIRGYLNFKEELSIQDGILFKGNRVIVPVALRPHMITQVHSSHLGIASCLNKARDVLFWPGMTAEIKDCVSKCETCNSYQTNQQKETLIPHDPPKRPWSHVLTDLFSFDNKEWFIIVDHWSDYFELNPLSSTNSSSVIKSLNESLLLTKKLGDQVKADFPQIALKFAAYQKEQNDSELFSKNAKTVETLASSMSSMTSAVMNLSKEVSSHAKGI